MKVALVFFSILISLITGVAHADTQITYCGDFTVENPQYPAPLTLKNQKTGLNFPVDLEFSTHRGYATITWSQSCTFLIIYPGSRNWWGLTLVNTKTLEVIRPSNLEGPAVLNGQTASNYSSLYAGIIALDDSGKYLALPGWFDSQNSVISYWNLETGKRFLDVPHQRTSINDLGVSFAKGKPIAIERSNKYILKARDLETGSILYRSEDRMYEYPSVKTFEVNNDKYRGELFAVIHSDDLKYSAELYKLPGISHYNIPGLPYTIAVVFTYNLIGQSKDLKTFTIETKNMCTNVNYICRGRASTESTFDSDNTPLGRDRANLMARLTYKPDSWQLEQILRHLEYFQHLTNAYFENDQFFIRNDFSDLTKTLAIDVL